MRFHRLCGALAAAALVAPVLETGCSGGSALPPELGAEPRDGGSGADATGAGGDDATSPTDSGTSPTPDATTGADGASGCGTCPQGKVCCQAPLGCAGMCVPDCRLGGACPSGLACDATTGVCTPAMTDGGQLPPPDGGMLPPPDGGMKPPPDGGMLPPPDGGMKPPPDGGMLPPPDGGMLPPPDGGTLPPPDGGSSSGDGGSGSDGGTVVPPGIGVITGSTGVRPPMSGNSVSIDDTTIVLGDSGSACYYGTASVYVWDGVSSWQLQQLLNDPNPVSGMLDNFNCFGGATAVHGDTAFVSSPQANGFAGIVYPYTRSGTTWTAGPSISNSNLGPAEFGYALAFDGTHLVVGAPAGEAVGGITYVGNVEIYTKSGPQWASQKLLSPPVAATETCFGTSVAMNGTRLAVGANGGPHDNYTIKGSAYSYQLVNGSWYFEAGAVGSDTGATDGFGTSVALAAGTPALMVVGAPGASPMGSGSGAAYVFFFDTGQGQWVQNAKLVPSDGVASDQFGYTVGAISSTQVAIGAPGANKVYLYTYSGGSWTLATTYQSCPTNVGTNMATWNTLLVTGKSSDVVIDTSLANPGCGGN